MLHAPLVKTLALQYVHSHTTRIAYRILVIIAKGWGCITNLLIKTNIISHANNMRTHIFIPRLFCMEHLGVIRIFSLKTADLHLFLLSLRRKVVECQTLPLQPEKIRGRVDRKTGGARIWLGEENCCYVPHWTTTPTLTIYTSKWS